MALPKLAREAPKYTDLQSGDLTFKKAERAKIAGPSQLKLG